MRYKRLTGNDKCSKTQTILQHKSPRIKDNNTVGSRAIKTNSFSLMCATSVMKEFRILMLIIIAVYVKRILGNRYSIQ